MLGFALRAVGRVHLVLLVLAVVLLLCQPTARRYGDRLQIALPMIAWGCAALNSSAAEFAARFLGMMVVTHTSKAALGNARINQRPSGGDKGFPSAHTAAAAFGASSLVSDCLSSHPTAKAIIVISAAFVGASRIDTRRHDIWQVLAGGLLGWGADRLVRRPRSRMRVKQFVIVARSKIAPILPRLSAIASDASR